MKKICSVLVTLAVGIFFIAAAMQQYRTQKDNVGIKEIKIFQTKNQPHMKQKYSNAAREKAIQHELANTGLPERVISIGKAVLQVELAQTPEERAIGLSHRYSLPEGYGMLFIFENEGSHSFWMKDTHFPIDIIWINTEKEVVYIEHSVTPETFPQSFTSPIPALYVLEIPAKYTKNRIMIGDTMLLK